jgi:hypothetical protein
MIQIVIRHRDPKILNQAARQMAVNLQAVFGNRVLGPNEPAVSRIQNFFIKNILLKFELSASPEKAKNLIKEIIIQVLADTKFKSLRVSLDVDPM